MTRGLHTALVAVLLAAPLQGAASTDPLALPFDLETELTPVLDRKTSAAVIDRLAEGARKRLADVADPAARPETLLRFLTQEAGYTPSGMDADLQEESLSRVLATGRGAPELLALLYWALAERHGMTFTPRYAPDRILLTTAEGLTVDLADKVCGLTDAAYRKRLQLPDQGPYLDPLTPQGLEAFLRRRRAEAFLAAGRRGPALADAERAVALDPSRPEHHATVARIHWASGDAKAAGAAIARAKAIHPEMPQALLLEATLLASEGQTERALEILGPAIFLASGPLQAELYRARAGLRASLGRLELARADVDKALSDGRGAASDVLARERLELARTLAAAARSRATRPALVLDPRQEVTRLLGLAREPDPARREEAQRVLAEMGPRAVPFLKEILTGPAGEAKLGALLLLAASANAACLEETKACLADPEPKVRLAALSALGALAESPSGREGILARAKDALADADPEVRRRTATLLARYRDPAALPYFRQALKDPEAENRRQAALTLGRMGERADIPLLREALADAHPRVRARAAQALGLLDATSSVPDLLNLLRDEDRDVRQEAAASLARITRKDFGQDVDAWEGWWRSQDSGP